MSFSLVQGVIFCPYYSLLGACQLGERLPEVKAQLPDLGNSLFGVSVRSD